MIIVTKVDPLNFRFTCESLKWQAYYLGWRARIDDWAAKLTARGGVTDPRPARFLDSAKSTIKNATLNNEIMVSNDSCHFIMLRHCLNTITVFCRHLILLLYRHSDDTSFLILLDNWQFAMYANADTVYSTERRCIEITFFLNSASISKAC